MDSRNVSNKGVLVSHIVANYHNTMQLNIKTVAAFARAKGPDWLDGSRVPLHSFYDNMDLLYYEATPSVADDPHS